MKLNHSSPRVMTIRVYLWQSFYPDSGGVTPVRGGRMDWKGWEGKLDREQQNSYSMEQCVFS